MRKWLVCGYKKVNYISKKTGKEVHGTTLYLSSDASSPDIVGDEHMELFIRSDSTYSPHVGDMIQVVYNRYGSVDDIIVC